MICTHDSSLSLSLPLFLFLSLPVLLFPTIFFFHFHFFFFSFIIFTASHYMNSRENVAMFFSFSSPLTPSPFITPCSAFLHPHRDAEILFYIFVLNSNREQTRKKKNKPSQNIECSFIKLKINFFFHVFQLPD